MNKKSFFWASYADLMTSLFFIMLVLFVLTVIMLKQQADIARDGKTAMEEQIKKIEEIENAVNNIDANWFDYNKEFKKHILKIDVSFPKGKSDIVYIPENIQEQLIKAGKSIESFIISAHNQYNVDYLLIVEGQASRDNYPYNYELSYSRALSLVRFWRSKGLTFDQDECELIISGSGQEGKLRTMPDNATNTTNQRFLIHIVPKPGIIEKINRPIEQ